MSDNVFSGGFGPDSRSSVRASIHDHGQLGTSMACICANQDPGIARDAAWCASRTLNLRGLVNPVGHRPRDWP
jgi:hypothetical protein